MGGCFSSTPPQAPPHHAAPPEVKAAAAYAAPPQQSHVKETAELNKVYQQQGMSQPVPVQASKSECAPGIENAMPMENNRGFPSRQTSKKGERSSGTSQNTPRRGVSFAGNSDFPGDSSPDARMSRSRRASAPKRSPSFVGADLHNIMDEQGMLHEGVSRQLSSMSHYSVRSESGNVIIEPEQPKAPFELLGLIGRGGFGNVYLGEWEGKKVAIKVMQGNCAEMLQPEEQRWEARKERMAQMEAVLMSAIHHPNIVNTWKDGVPSFEWHIIMEFCDKGSLSRELASFKFHRPLDDRNVGWDAWASLEVLKEVVHALKFLHEHKIIHGDLKAANVLLSSSDQDRRGWIGKLSDFGLSRVMSQDKGMITTRTFGTVTHMPSELLARGHLLPSSDVYAFGIVMWEVFTGEKVFKQLSDSAVVLAVVTKKARPTFPSDCPSRYRFLAESFLCKQASSCPCALPLPGQDSPLIPCKVYPSRQNMLGQYIQYLASKEEAAQKAKEKAQAQAQAANSSDPNLPARRSALKSGPSQKSLRINEARFGDSNSNLINGTSTREGVKRGVQDYGVQEQPLTSHKSMHARIAGPPSDKEEEEEEEEQAPTGPRSLQRRAKSMVARRQHSFHTANVPKAERTQDEESESREGGKEESGPSRPNLGGMRPKSQSFATLHSKGSTDTEPESRANATNDLPPPLDNNYIHDAQRVQAMSSQSGLPGQPPGSEQSLH
ncbi:kinase-like domain-containing protein [Dunaliella salina]|uniref:Kinase-like domain-containing protein n=1 Tax=Dunaliella salina TaxID=3046 RepID=A0ABQ7GG39_DUNSA|nr:kinase-like domain-containing protein [Dunaliella salina]|eukprot:KAF5833571.1 kinase-like domain-containing protein [Dunaliella salina]